MLRHLINCRIILILFFYIFPRKNEGGKKLRKVERGLKWKTSPGVTQRENRRAAIIIIILLLLLLLFNTYLPT